MSSTDDKTTPSVDACASCGIAEVDDIELKMCDGGCDLVKYCSDNCQTNHREQHEDCKKRLAVLHYKKLFTQPDSSFLGECPICCLPLPIDGKKSSLMGCCCKKICNGCNYANIKRENEQGLEQRCAFCREPAAESQQEYNKRVMNRIKKNDPVAMTHMGRKHQQKGDYDRALEYYTKAAEFGDVEAHGCLGNLYYDGDGVDTDMKKAVYHLEQAAIGGHPDARGILACYEIDSGRFNKAAKHLMINANLGDDISLQQIKGLFMQGIVSKEEYAAALRAYQAAVNETKSAEREKAESYYARS